MTTEKMTIHKALAELKIIDSRISNEINNATFVIANKHSNEKIKGIAISDFSKTMQSSWDKSNDLINRRNAIKRAVVLSNATTKVTVGTDTYTVAEAIEMKNHGIDFVQMLKNSLVNQYNKAQSEVIKNNGEDLDKRAEQYVNGLYGGKEGKTDTADFEKVRNDFVKSNSYELVDPIKVAEKIEILDNQINEFITEVDSALSTSNALTFVEINY